MEYPAFRMFLPLCLRRKGERLQENRFNPKSETGLRDLHSDGKIVLIKLQYKKIRIVIDSVQSLSHDQIFGTPSTAACQAPLSLGFSRQEYWSRLPWPPPGDLPDPGTEPGSLSLQADSLPSEPQGKPSCLLMSSQIKP